MQKEDAFEGHNVIERRTVREEIGVDKLQFTDNCIIQEINLTVEHVS